jgi:hypothetical protein
VTRTLKPAAVAALLLAGGLARADGYLDNPYRLTALVSIGWEIGVPVGSLRDFASATSIRGGVFEARIGIVRHFSLGLSTTWNWFSKNSSQETLTFPNSNVTGAVYQRVQFFTLRGTGHWYMTDGPLQPYLGLGLGVAWNNAYREVADVSISENGFNFAGDPQLGLLWTVAQGLALNVQARFQFTFTKFFDVKNAHWLGIDIGMALF